MKRITIKLESDIELIPFYLINKKSKYLDFKFLFVRLIIKGII